MFQNNILRLPDVLVAMGFSKSTLYSRIKNGLMTRPVNLGGRIVGWPSQEVSRINAARIASKSNDEITGLVCSLEANRSNREV